MVGEMLKERYYSDDMDAEGRLHAKQSFQLMMLQVDDGDEALDGPEFTALVLKFKHTYDPSVVISEADQVCPVVALS